MQVFAKNKGLVFVQSPQFPQSGNFTDSIMSAKPWDLGFSRCPMSTCAAVSAGRTRHDQKLLYLIFRSGPCFKIWKLKAVYYQCSSFIMPFLLLFCCSLILKHIMVIQLLELPLIWPCLFHYYYVKIILFVQGKNISCISFI